MKYLLVLIVLVSFPVAALAQNVDGPSAAARAALADVSQEERNRALLMRLYEEAWNRDQYAVADEIFAADYVRHDASDPGYEREESALQSEIAREIKTIIPDLWYEFDVVMADDDLVAVRWTATGTPVGAPGLMRRLVGKSGPMEVTGVNMFRIHDGQVVEQWNNRDNLTIRREMGMFRWVAAGGFVAGVLITLLFSWGVRRWRRSRSGLQAASAA